MVSLHKFFDGRNEDLRKIIDNIFIDTIHCTYKSGDFHGIDLPIYDSSYYNPYNKRHYFCKIEAEITEESSNWELGEIPWWYNHLHIPICKLKYWLKDKTEKYWYRNIHAWNHGNLKDIRKYLNDLLKKSQVIYNNFFLKVNMSLDSGFIIHSSIIPKETTISKLDDNIHNQGKIIYIDNKRKSWNDGLFHNFTMNGLHILNEGKCFEPISTLMLFIEKKLHKRMVKDEFKPK